MLARLYETNTAHALSCGRSEEKDKPKQVHTATIIGTRQKFAFGDSLCAILTFSGHVLNADEYRRVFPNDAAVVDRLGPALVAANIL